MAASPHTSCHRTSWCSCAEQSQLCSSSAVAKANRPVVSHLVRVWVRGRGRVRGRVRVRDRARARARQV